MEQLNKATVIEGVASTSARDSQGEVLDLDGADITPLLEGKGFVNSDHSGRFEHLVGRVLEAKKIKKLADCETPAQIKFLNEVKKPFIWTKLELWDGHGHKEADSIGSIYKFYNEKNEAPPIKLSVEGKTIERGANGVLKRTLIKGVALTVHPANQTTKTEVVGLVKSAGGPDSLVKSESYDVPVFVERADSSSIEKLFELAIQARELIKSISPESKPSGKSLLKCQSALERLRILKGLTA